MLCNLPVLLRTLNHPYQRLLILTYVFLQFLIFCFLSSFHAIFAIKLYHLRYKKSSIIHRVNRKLIGEIKKDILLDFYICNTISFSVSSANLQFCPSNYFKLFYLSCLFFLLAALCILRYISALPTTRAAAANAA